MTQSSGDECDATTAISEQISFATDMSLAKLTHGIAVSKPHLRHAVSYDCGWQYPHWICYDAWTKTKAIGATPKEAYMIWKLQIQMKKRAQYYGRSPGAPRP